MSEITTFPTLNVASCACGIMLTDGLRYSDMAEIAEYALGHPVWAHELGDQKTMGRVREAIFDQFPEFPTKQEAQDDWRAAADKATKAYGESVDLRRGDQVRVEDPTESLQRMIGGGAP